MLFHLAGIPSYLVVAELAINRVLRGELPCPGACPEKLRHSAAERRHGTVRATLAYARANHAPKGNLTEVVGALAVTAVQAGHGVSAGRGEWVTNEKRLLERAGLRRIDDIVAELRPEPEALARAGLDADAVLGASRGQRSGNCPPGRVLRAQGSGDRSPVRASRAKRRQPSSGRCAHKEPDAAFRALRS